MLRQPPRGLYRARCPNLPTRTERRIRGMRRPRGSSCEHGCIEIAFERIGSISSYIERFTVAGEEHICRRGPVSMGWALLPAAIEPASGNTTHKLPRPTASILSRRLHTLNSSCRVPRCNRSGPGVVGVWSSKLSQSWWSLKASLVGCRRLEPGATNCQGRWSKSRDTAFGPTSPQATSQSPGLDPPSLLHPTLPLSP